MRAEEAEDFGGPARGLGRGPGRLDSAAERTQGDQKRNSWGRTRVDSARVNALLSARSNGESRR